MNTFKLYTALSKRAFFILWALPLIFFSISCSTNEVVEGERKVKPSSKVNKSDYVDHLEYLAIDYLSTEGVRERRTSRKTKKYLHEIYNRIVANNELILKKKIIPKFHIIRSKNPFYFSLPSGRFFLSDTLIKKYTKSENLLISLLATEIYRVHNDLYNKEILIPVGYISTKRFLSLSKLPMSVKVENLKWTYFILKRSGYDPYSVLNWIQTQNKNSFEFSTQLGNSQSQTREEFLFKNFLATEVGKRQNEEEAIEKNSSKEFYYLQRSLI